jgi:hypothetical protein
MIYRVRDKANELSELRQKGHTKGLSTGFTNLDENFTLKLGFPLFVAGSPYAGKTEFVIEMLLNTSVLYGWKHFIYCGEGGEIEEIIADIAHKYIAKPFKSGFEYSMTESEKTQAEMFIDSHFVFLSDQEDYTLSMFYELASQAEIELGIKFNTTCFDPFNDVVDESYKFGNRDDKWLASELKLARRSSKENHRIDILVNHIADIYPITDKDSGQRYTPPALPSEWAGGRTWWRRAFTMILIYRPPTFLKNEYGANFKPNETHVIIQKSKPKGIGKTGQQSLYFDWKMNRYYWENTYSEKFFAFGVKKTDLKQFQDETAPF